MDAMPSFPLQDPSVTPGAHVAAVLGRINPISVQALLLIGLALVRIVGHLDAVLDNHGSNPVRSRRVKSGTVPVGRQSGSRIKSSSRMSGSPETNTTMEPGI